jgi:Transcriptional regulators
MAATLKEKAYLQLKQLIREGRFQSGEMLTERHLVEMLEMSRTPIRAALERLEAEGLVQYTPNKGIQLLEISLQRAVDLYDFRMAIETYIARKLSACILTSEQIEKVQANLDEQKFHMQKDDYEAFTKADLEFHLLLAHYHENLEMIHAIDRLQNQLFRIALNVMRKDRNRIRVSYEDHVSIFEHIRSGDAAGAGETMLRHLEFGKQILVM